MSRVDRALVRPFEGHQESEQCRLAGATPADDRDPLAARPRNQLGLIVLVATPIVRVAASLVGFALEGDRLYVGITAVVLAILLASVLLIR